MSICAENITWKVGKKAIVNDVSLKVSRETVGLLGPNGCGKSSLCVSSRDCVARMRAA